MSTANTKKTESATKPKKAVEVKEPAKIHPESLAALTGFTYEEKPDGSFEARSLTSEEKADLEKEKAAEPKKSKPFLVDHSQDTMCIFPIKTKEELDALPRPFVMVNNQIIQPVVSGVKLKNGLLKAGDSQDAYIHYNVNRGIGDEKTFSLYTVELLGGKFEFWLDDSSYLVLRNRDYRRYGAKPRGGRYSILCNSTSREDTLEGANVLVNTDSEYNSIVDSVFTNMGSFSFKNIHPSMQASGIQAPSKPRLSIDSSNFEHTVVESSSIAKGTYIESEIVDSTIKSEQYVHANEVRMQKSHLMSEYITMSKATLQHVSIRANNKLVIRNCRLNRMNFESATVYFMNKFSYMKVDVPDGAIEMARISKTHVEVAYRYGTPVVIPIGASWNEIEEQVSKLIAQHNGSRLFDSKETLENPITNSIIQYVTDTLASRLTMIALLDSAADVQNSIEMESQAYGYEYAPF